MTPITQAVPGRVYAKGDQVALLLDEQAEKKYLRFALPLQGLEHPIFPALLLDDWGKEIGGLALYHWLNEYGSQFPRAELFGFELTGRDTQHFLRDFELYFNYPCYLYANRHAPVPAGTPLTTILLPDPQHKGQPIAAKAPAGTPLPLRRAAVQWLLIDPATLPSAGFTPSPKNS